MIEACTVPAPAPRQARNGDATRSAHAARVSFARRQQVAADQATANDAAACGNARFCKAMLAAHPELEAIHAAIRARHEAAHTAAVDSDANNRAGGRP